MNYCLACSGGSCVAGYTVQTYVKQGSADNGLTCEQSPQPNKVCPEICQSNTKSVCCLEGGKQLMPHLLGRSQPFIYHTTAGFTNCEWVGDPPNCLNAACRAGQICMLKPSPPPSDA